MGTRSTIGILNDDGTVTSIYCHWDGYLDYNGRILTTYYTDEERVRELISLGSISSLGPKLNPSTDKHDFDSPEDDVVVAYHRDRGEDLHVDTDESEESFRVRNLDDVFQEYTYFFKREPDSSEKRWYVVDYYHEEFTLVTNELIKSEVGDEEE